MKKGVKATQWDSLPSFCHTIIVLLYECLNYHYSMLTNRSQDLLERCIFILRNLLKEDCAFAPRCKMQAYS